MADPAQSPAVQSLMKERARQNLRSTPEDLDKALKDTFPASDPVSMAQTAVPAGRADADTAERIAHSDAEQASDAGAPLVDEALGATGEGRNARHENAVLRREADRAAETVSEFAQASKEVAKSRAMSVVQEFEDYARRKPLKAAFMVGAAAFLLGITR